MRQTVKEPKISEWRFDHGSDITIRRKFSKEVKLAALQRLGVCVSPAEVVRVFEVNANLLHRWLNRPGYGLGNAFPGKGKRRRDETKVAKLDAF